MKRQKREWKARAEEATGPALFEAQRERLAAGVARRLFPRGAAGARHRGGDESFRIGHLAVTLLPFVDEPWARAGLAARCLDDLQEALNRADYEDVQLLDQQLRWAEGCLRALVQAVVTATSLNGHGTYAEAVLAELTEWIAVQITPVLATAA